MGWTCGIYFFILEIHFREIEIVKKFFVSVVILMYVILSIGCGGISEKETIDREITAYLRMSVQEILDLTNANIDEESSVVVFEPDIFFTYIEKDPFFIICRSRDTTYTPLCISLYQDYDNDYLAMLKLNCEMNFQEIMEVMGTVSIEQSSEREEDKRYMISFTEGELRYYFCSDNQDGREFELFIGLVEK